MHTVGLNQSYLQGLFGDRIFLQKGDHLHNYHHVAYLLRKTHRLVYIAQISDNISMTTTSKHACMYVDVKMCDSETYKPNMHKFHREEERRQTII